MRVNNNQDHLTFKKGRKKKYTPHQRKIMADMKRVALQNNWVDIYTGEPFTPDNRPTIEHIIPHSMRQSLQVRALRQKRGHFEVNGLDNIFPAGNLGNSERGNTPFKLVVSRDPSVLNRLLTELDKYRKHQSELIDGKKWFNRLLQTLLHELEGMSSNIQTKALQIK